MFADTILGMGRTSVFESAVDPEIEAVTPDTVEECAGDPFEFLTAAYYESQLDMVNINQAIMVCEYAYLKENGQEMVYEANVVTSMFKKIGEKIKAAWKKICQFFKSIFTWLDGVVRNDKKFVEKYESKIKDIDSVDIGSFNGYTYADKSTSFDVKGNSIIAAASAMFTKISNKAKALKNDKDITKDTKVEDVLDAFRGSLLGESSIKSDALAEKLTKKFRGDEVSASTFNNAQLSNMLEIIKNTKATKAHLNTIYKECKGAVDAMLSFAKASEQEANAVAGKKDSDDAKNWHVKATILNSLTGITTMVNNKACKAITAHNRQCRGIIGKAVVKAEKDKKDSKEKTSAGESASMIDQIFESFGL